MIFDSNLTYFQGISFILQGFVPKQVLTSLKNLPHYLSPFLLL
jgi:hypothetical protein